MAFNFSEGFEPVHEKVRLLPGDHIRLIDNCGTFVASGVLLKSDDEHYLIKNLRTKALKKVERDRYKVLYKKHMPRSSDLGKQLRAILLQRQEADSPSPAVHLDPSFGRSEGGR